MDFFQQLVLTAFLAFVFAFVIVKFVSLAFSNSSDDGKTAIFSVDEVNSGNGLKVGRTKSKKRVKFADDLVSKIDQYQGEKGFENLGLCLDESGRGVIAEEKSEDEEIAKRVDQFEGGELNGNSEIKISGMVLDSVDEDKVTENIGMLIEKTDEGHEIGEISGVIFGDKKNGENEELIKGDVEEENFDDDWEGIERSDLDKVFAEAVNYVEYGGKGKGKGKGKEKGNDKLDKLPSNVQMQLYGLHKVAVEGPCHEPQPMALKMSSRAKWNAWQRLGSMTQEEAMEQYIKILSDSVPEWMQNYSADDDMQCSGTPGNSESQLRSLLEDERKEELKIVTDVGDSGMDANSAYKEKKGEDQLTA